MRLLLTFTVGQNAIFKTHPVIQLMHELIIRVIFTVRFTGLKTLSVVNALIFIWSDPQAGVGFVNCCMRNLL